MSELKPCPFCGKLPESQISIFGKDSAWCGNSSCRMNSGTCYTLDEWQHRPLEDALQAKLDIAVEALATVANQPYGYTDNIPFVHVAQEALKKLEAK